MGWDFQEHKTSKSLDFFSKKDLMDRSNLFSNFFSTFFKFREFRFFYRKNESKNETIDVCKIFLSRQSINLQFYTSKNLRKIFEVEAISSSFKI